MKVEEREQTERLLDSLLVFDVDRKIAELAGFYRRSIKSHHPFPNIKNPCWLFDFGFPRITLNYRLVRDMPERLWYI